MFLHSFAIIAKVSLLKLKSNLSIEVLTFASSTLASYPHIAKYSKSISCPSINSRGIIELWSSCPDHSAMILLLAIIREYPFLNIIVLFFSS
jgi:hypothetical protein